jgi:hypothetical protein
VNFRLPSIDAHDDFVDFESARVALRDTIALFIHFFVRSRTLFGGCDHAALGQPVTNTNEHVSDDFGAPNIYPVAA